MILELPSGKLDCFYKDVTEIHTKLNIYFASYQGGDFTVNLAINDPDQNRIINAELIKQGDYSFTANRLGEYSFCFYNPGSEEKLIDFEILDRADKSIVSPLVFEDPGHLTNMNKLLFTFQDICFEIIRGQKYFRNLEARNESIIQQLGSTLHSYQFALLSIVCVMTLIQIFAIKSFFK
ncbi:hypothetical protein K502DRAFT_297585 [Neoconidiobolus thromboides FSU 785]|nr:hypothetical protein K502DRAFT_297585 [Neoconidiobolus thromboides FSU 785]